MQRLWSVAVATSLVALALVLGGSGTSSAFHTGKPNILIIVTDDQRAGTVDDVVDENGVPQVWMPQVKSWFGAGGTEYSGFVTTPECCPSRASILTGQFAHNHGVQSIWNDPVQGSNNRGADRLNQNDTLERYLHDNGYYTGIFGKFMNSWNTTNKPTYFDEWGIFNGDYGNWPGCTLNPNPPNDALDCVMTVQEGTGVDSPAPPAVTNNEYSTAYVQRKTIDFLTNRAPSAQPWFLYVAPYAPHPPARPDLQYKDTVVPDPNYTRTAPSAFESALTDKPLYVQGKDPAYPSPGPFCCGRVPGNLNTVPLAQQIRTRQLQTLKSVDDMVGAIRTAVGTDLNSTLAIFISDNGFLWGEHWIEGKMNPYTESVQVPMYMTFPGHVAPNAIDTARPFSTNVDIAPTIIGASNTPIPLGAPAWDGMNLFASESPRTHLLSEFFKETDFDPATTRAFEPIPTWATVRHTNAQYMEIYDSAGNVAEREYYDLVNDPFQLVNILKDGIPGNDSQANTLKKELGRERNCAGRVGHQVAGRNPCP